MPVFMNGEARRTNRQDYPVLRALADERELLSLPELSNKAAGLLCQWYLDGYISMSAVRR